MGYVYPFSGKGYSWVMNCITWVIVPHIRVHEEPVVKCEQLEESEAGSPNVTIPVWIHITVQTSTNDGKDIYNMLRIELHHIQLALHIPVISTCSILY